MKQMMTVDQLIQHMNKKGIKFELCTEEEAKVFLKETMYYFKVAAYRQLYPKILEGNRKGQYQKLDFAYLKELYNIDASIRNMIRDMCLDIETQIKVKLINSTTQNENEDGYSLVKNYLTSEDKNFHTLKNIQQHKSGEYCRNLIKKYYPFFPIWVLVELISFGTLLHICQYYEDSYKEEIIPKNKFMNIIRDLRNATSHNNCLINNIAEKMDESKHPDIEITNFIKRLNIVSTQTRRKQLRKKFVYNIVVLLFVYCSLIPIEAKRNRIRQLKELMDSISTNDEFFKSNPQITSVNNFFNKLIDTLAEEC